MSVFRALSLLKLTDNTPFHSHTHTLTHKGLSTWVSASVLMNLSPGGGAGLMSHTKSPRWATEPTRGQQINLHYISIPTIHLMRGDYMRESVCRLSWYCITNEIRVSLLLIQFADSDHEHCNSRA